MKRFKIFWVNTGELRKDILTLMVVLTTLGFAYPWIAKGVNIVLPFIGKYYDWVTRF